MQSEEKPVMATGLERIAAKAREEPKLRFTSLAHHITGERVLRCDPNALESGIPDACSVPKENDQSEAGRW
jgi:hypothetical protein